MYVTTKKILSREALQVFENKSPRNETTVNYKIVVDGLTNYFFPPKYLHFYKR